MWTSRGGLKYKYSPNARRLSLPLGCTDLVEQICWCEDNDRLQILSLLFNLRLCAHRIGSAQDCSDGENGEVNAWNDDGIGRYDKYKSHESGETPGFCVDSRQRLLVYELMKKLQPQQLRLLPKRFRAGK